MTRKRLPEFHLDREIRPGDFVTVVAGPDSHHVGMVGIFDNEWMHEGVLSYVVLFGEDDFTYATEISLHRKNRRNTA